MSVQFPRFARSVVAIVAAAGVMSLAACASNEANYRPAPKTTTQPTYTQPTYSQPTYTPPPPQPTAPPKVACGGGKCG